jgi:tRNA G18 (ribose-2'-O)-methylase SpoU
LPTHLSDPADPLLADYAVVSDPDLGTNRGVFIAEGRLVVRRLLAQRSLIVRSVLVTPTAKRALHDALEARPDVPVFVVPQEEMTRVAGFNIHRGCLAAAARPAPNDWRDLAANSRRLVVLERVGDVDNVGAIFRSAAAFAAGAVLIGPGCADPLYRKAIRSSMGAALTLPFATAVPWPGPLADLVTDAWTIAALTPSLDAMPLRAFATLARDRKTTLVLGHEGEGLSEDALAACTHRVRIPIGRHVDSLNVATAAAIALYELDQA